MANPIKRARAKKSNVATVKESLVGAENKISAEELKELQDTNSELVLNMRKIATAALEKMNLEEQLFDLREENESIKSSMEEKLKSLAEKYSVAHIDLATGEFKTMEDVEKENEILKMVSETNKEVSE